jgi:hypothetical protein
LIIQRIATEKLPYPATIGAQSGQNVAESVNFRDVSVPRRIELLDSKEARGQAIMKIF